MCASLRTRAASAVLGLLAACDTAGSAALGPTAPRDGGAASLDAASFTDAGSGPLDAGPRTARCPEIDPDRDLQELHALALAPARAVVVGRPGPVESVGPRTYRAFDIDEVRYGVAAMRGQRVWMEGERAELEGLEDEPHVAAFGAFNPFPVAADGRRIWRPHVLRPLADAGPLEPLGYQREPGSRVAVVRIAEQGERTTYEVVEVLQGDELPPRLLDPWVTRERIPALPGPGEATYIASFRHVTTFPGTGETTAVAVDLRDDTREHRAAVAAAFSEPARLDVAAADAAVERLRSAWNYGRADRVVRAEVDGVADDNGTSAGGMALRNRVVELIRGPELASFVHGGHAAFFDEACGAAQLYALGDDVQSTPPEGADFGCDGRGVLPPFEQLGGVIERRAATPEVEATVREWTSAEPPLFRLWPEDAPVTPTDVVEPSDNLLSARPEWVQVVAHGRWTWARVASRGSVDGHTELTFELTFTPHAPSAPPGARVRSARVVTRCALPELTVGTTWLLGYFADSAPDTGDLEIGPRSSMLFAGPWLEATAANRLTLNALATEIWSRR